MFEAAISVRLLKPYVIEIAFEDGTRRTIDIEPFCWGEGFAPLRDPDLFAQVNVDPTFGSDSRVISPPILVASARLIVRPSPGPWVRRK